MTCPDDDTLAALASLPDPMRAAIIDHAASCATCRAVVFEILEPPAALAATIDVSDSAPAAPAPDEPTQIDRYRIERRIGAGAMGVVYAAYDPELARRVAIKLLRFGGSADRMRREAQALAKLRHPNVVAVYDVGDHAGTAFVTMELVEGENLRTWLRGEHSMAERVDAIVQAARGIEAAHGSGIVHRDIKPDNIFVASSGTVLVGDFGLAATQSSLSGATDPTRPASELTATGSVVGTPAYMPPEQLSGEASAASDQFAYCVTAWETLYGVRPFSGGTMEELAAAVYMGRPTEPEGRRVPAHVRAALRRGLAADPKARHASMRDLLAALAPRRRRWPYALGAIGLAGTIATVMAVRGEDPQAQALARCDHPSGPAAWPLVERAITAGRLAGEKPALAAAILRLGDRYADAWSALRREACLANARREVSDPVFAAQDRCLERRARAFAWALDPRSTAKAYDTLGFLETIEPVETCRGRAAGGPAGPEVPALETELDALSMRSQTADAAWPDPSPVIARAEKLGDPSLAGEAHYLQAFALAQAGRDADPELVLAIAKAEQASDDRLRARASAYRAVVAARAGRIVEAIGHRDLARSALARSTDPTTSVAVERAGAEIERAKGDVTAEIATLRRIEAIESRSLGAPSRTLADAAFALGTALLRADDPAWRTALARGVEMTGTLSERSPLDALDAAALLEHAPGRRIPILQRMIAVVRTSDPARLPQLLVDISNDYEVTGDWERALAAVLEARELLPADAIEPRGNLTEAAASHALNVAYWTDEPTVREKRLAQALSLLETLPPAVREIDTALSTRGRALVLAGRYDEAIPVLGRALALAEHADPPAPFKVMVRAFILAQARWEIGTPRERDRARALADQAAARIPEARAFFEANREAYGSTLDLLARYAGRLDAWRKTHR